MSVTPDFIGQYYRNTTTGDIWKANSLTPGDWSLVCQDLKIRWTPGFKMEEVLCPLAWDWKDGSGADYSGPLTIGAEYLESGLSFNNCDQLTSLSCPNLKEIDPNFIALLDVSIVDCPALASISMPLLAKQNGGKIVIHSSPLLTALNLASLDTMYWDFDLDGSPLLASLSLPALTAIDGNFTAKNCTALASISFPNYLPSNGYSFDFTNNGLDVTSVDHILARCVASASFVTGFVKLEGGTNAAPSSIGPGSDYDILTVRGITVTKN